MVNRVFDGVNGALSVAQPAPIPQR
jgi:hypothetical protein